MAAVQPSTISFVDLYNELEIADRFALIAKTEYR